MTPPVRPDVSIIDCDRGNLRSLAGALDRIGVTHERAGTPEEINAAARLILPGVGAFGRFMDALRERGLVEPILAAARRGTPLLGICVGMQVLAARGTEHGEHAGLGLIEGAVERITPAGRSARVPHVGWNRVAWSGEHPIAGDSGDAFYFVHSYALRPADNDVVIARCEHGGPVVAAVARENILGVQFHPEKSQEAGLELLRRFCQAAA